jgi:hypothetical protein
VRLVSCLDAPHRPQSLRQGLGVPLSRAKGEDPAHAGGTEQELREKIQHTLGGLKLKAPFSPAASLLASSWSGFLTTGTPFNQCHQQKVKAQQIENLCRCRATSARTIASAHPNLFLSCLSLGSTHPRRPYKRGLSARGRRRGATTPPSRNSAQADSFHRLRCSLRGIASDRWWPRRGVPAARGHRDHPRTPRPSNSLCVRPDRCARLGSIGRAPLFHTKLMPPQLPVA